jgi:hypothetical protein
VGYYEYKIAMAYFKLLLPKRGIKGKLREVTVVTVGLMTRIIATDSTDTDSIPGSLRKVLKIERILSNFSCVSCSPLSYLFRFVSSAEKNM